MNQIRRRPRAIAIARTDESRQQKAVLTRLALIAFFAVAALAALPALWF
ncbi:hypothetical protein ACI2KT_02600 [Ensifer adhaerens]|jgi:hypothetical protein|uniref:Uncharacterized protein n=1 Tax=Ensifer adhaerens TaxID=106592 RepID=A0A9Q9DA08_ENSAD|nr:MULTISPECIES: hypothetical protein [Ensifer]KSV67757.1 hypothetical protein N182_05910 [Sinorhizobium sp. GL2]MBD9492930.1 hypothetical protein [Ensifer sp. ENS01]MBD9521099.1 hypothetical protein [Ensifer sp. ENS02]MBD9538528.1 hypothetical protein [Ensifer sp. ENS04]MBD9567364.1 hypothetical protein [Ensifer sp. ENS08]